MAISDNKITNAEIAEVHVQAAPDTLTGSAQQNKAVFDAYSDLIKGKHNSLIDDIDGEYASNWRNGSQTGSVRTTGSEEEGDYYTIGQYATAEGRQTKASESNSHAEGFRTQARGDTSHAEGYFATADGNNSHAEGRETIASGKNSHAEGLFANASGDNSHAEGNSAEASGNNSHAEGYGTIASSSDQHVSGRYNIEDTNNIYAEIIGNGTSLGRGNGRTLDWNGNEVLAGKLTVGTEPENNKDVATKGYVDTGLAGKVDKVTGKGLSTEDYTTSEKAKLSNIEAGAEVNVQADWNQSDSNADDYIKNKPIIKEGTGTGSIIENDTNNIASGTNSHAEGYLTKAVESFTHVNGVGTEAHGYAETVIGQYNDYDAMTEPYVFVIGNGYEDGDRSNAHTTDWQGNAWYAGEVTDGTGNVLSEKVDKETGKGLSTNDYTTAEKMKLSGIAAGAEVNVQSDWSQNNSNADDYIKNKPTLPSKTSDLTNDSDYTTKQYVDGKLPIGEASGSIASVKDGADGMPMKSLTATIVPKQSGSGTPSPDNVREISGWESVETSVCGKNLLDEQNTTIYKRFLRALGSNNAEWAESNDSASVAVACKPNTTYTITASNSSATLIRAAWVDYNPDDVQTGQTPQAYGLISHSPYSAITITTGTSAKYLIVQCNVALVEAKTAKLQVELGTTATDYEPYTATTHTTSLGRTVYGGTVDVVSGVLTVTWFSILGTAWTQYNASNGYKAYKVTNVPKAKFGVDGKSNMISEYGSFNSGAMTKNIIQLADNTGTTYMALDESISPSDVQLIYTLDTPQTYTLTPQQINTLLGVNNVWADSGDCSIEYVRDIGLALDNLLPDSPTTDGTYTLVCTVSDGKAILAWQSSGASLSSPLSMSSPAVLNINTTEGE